MRLSINLQRRSPVLISFATTAILISHSLAQNDDNEDDPPAPSSTGPIGDDGETDENLTLPNEEPAPTDNSAAPESTNADGDEEEEEEATTTGEGASSSTNSADEDEDEETCTEEDEATSTSAQSSASETPDPTTTSDDGDDGLITGGPTLTRGYGIPTYPAPAVPPTENAPFMQHSRAPDGTVFIAVGAILGAFLLAILLWRLIVSLLLHRSVKRAAMAQHEANSKAGFPAPPAQFYKYTDQGSTMSLGASAAVAGRGVRRTNRGPIPSATPSHSNLFFSPTAAATNNTSGNRSSAFLPSGFYAAAGGNNPSHGHSISLTNLRPDSRGHAANGSRHTLNQTPPDSPAFPARRDISATSLNLNRPSSQRAPSAYLDDLLADDPSALPPPNMTPGQGPRNSTYMNPNRI